MKTKSAPTPKTTPKTTPKATPTPTPKATPKATLAKPSHPLVGKMVTGDVTADKNVGRKAHRVRGVLVAYDPTCICIGKTWFWTSSIVNLKEAK